MSEPSIPHFRDVLDSVRDTVVVCSPDTDIQFGVRSHQVLYILEIVSLLFFRGQQISTSRGWGL